MIDSPVARALYEKAERKTARTYIENLLLTRFGRLSDDGRARLEGVTDESKLLDLHRFATICPSMEAFVERLHTETNPKPAPTSSRRKKKS